jgi:Domain of unknown function (DUF1902)
MPVTENSHLQHHIHGISTCVQNGFGVLRMKNLSIVVRAMWDEEARVWFATSSDIDGLAVEADTLEALEKKAIAALVDLIELNGDVSDLPEIPVHFMAEHMTRITNPRW